VFSRYTRSPTEGIRRRTNPPRARPCREFKNLRIENLMFNRRNIAVNIRTRAAGVDLSNFPPDMTCHFPSICFSVKSPVPKRVSGKPIAPRYRDFSRVQEPPGIRSRYGWEPPSLAVPPKTCTTFSANLACGAIIRKTNCRNGACG
jgi:hypothetical protein